VAISATLVGDLRCCPEDPCLKRGWTMARAAINSKNTAIRVRLNHMCVEWHCRFEIFSYALDELHLGWDDSRLRAYVEGQKTPYEVEQRDTCTVIKEKFPEVKPIFLYVLGCAVEICIVMPKTMVSIRWL
jgi:hypothetical protein